MDHNGLLTLIDRAQKLFTPKKVAAWRWEWTVIPFPEAPCAYCGRIMRSPYLWVVNDKDRILYGVVEVKQGLRARITYNDHPHALNKSGVVCIGNAENVHHFLSSPINLRDIPNRDLNIPNWIRTYWNHQCLYTAGGTTE